MAMVMDWAPGRLDAGNGDGDGAGDGDGNGVDLISVVGVLDIFLSSGSGRGHGLKVDWCEYCAHTQRRNKRAKRLTDGAAGEVVFAEILTTPVGQSKGCG